MADAEAKQEVVHEWPPLESDPETFAKLAEFLGLEKGDGKVSINEVFGFDEGLLMMLPNQVAALTCMRRMPDKKAADKERGDPSTKAAFYMKQSGTLDNACGIIALIHSILNTLDADGVGLTEGSPLAQFQSDNAGKTPEERCASLEGFTAIHDFYKDIQTEGSQDNVDGVHEHGGVSKTFHFVAYALNEDGALVEFDGTKQGPWVVSTKEEVDACGGMLNSFGKEMQRRLADGEIDPDAMSAMALGPAPAW